MAAGISHQQACPNCTALVRIQDVTLVGAKIECPRCKHRFVAAKPRNQYDTESVRPESSVAADPAWPGTGPSLPEQFGRYRILKKLGQGGMGAVYLAHDTKLDRRVALKVPRFEAEEGSAGLQRFSREARAAATLHHPNICTVHDVGEIDGVHYLTMAFVEGLPLSELIRQGGPLPQAQAAELVRQIALALQVAHERGIIHRDLKPGNIMLTAQQQPIVMDFGLARHLGKEDSRLTASGTMLGTPAYMPPEQVRGKLTALGPRSDIYSLGVVLYELLTGRLPFRAPSAMAMVAAVLTQKAPRPSRFRPDLDPRLEAICLKAMAKKPEERYASMAELAQALEVYLRGPIGQATQKVERPATQVQQARRLPWPVLAGVGAVALAAAVLGVVLVFSTARGTVRIELSDPAAKVEIRVDKDVIDITGLEQPLHLRVGEHHLLVQGRDFETESRWFAVTRGPNEVLRVTLVPRKAPATAQAAKVEDKSPVVAEVKKLEEKKPAIVPVQKVEEKKPAMPTVTKEKAPRPADLPFDASQARAHQEAWAEHLGVPVETKNTLGMTLGLIPPGKYVPASPGQGELSKLEVLAPFYLGAYEVTQDEYQKIMGTNPSTFKQDAGRHPVEQVSWLDAVAFCNKLSAKEGWKPYYDAEGMVLGGKGYRLPTEAEWEYACRSGTTTAYSFGDGEALLGEHAWYVENSGNKTYPVASKKANAFGLYDMHGNVWEWCEDLDGTVGPARVNRGGSWGNIASYCRSALRGGAMPADRSYFLGFRLARVPSGVAK